MSNKIIKVAVPIQVNSFFSYSIPPSMDIDDVIGKRVLVNFKNRLLRGYAVAKENNPGNYKIKEIDKVIDKRRIFDNKAVEFSKWMANYYFCGIGEVLSLIVPRGIIPSKENSVVPHTCQTITLNAGQNKIFNNILSDIKAGKDKFFLYGITGSGKTEIYIKLIEYFLNQNKTIIFLVPEIFLSFQTLQRLQESFGNKCAILHSNLRGSVRLKEYLRLFDGEAKIAIGPRSAIFAPVKNLGLIIIDEENDSAYKSDERPRFHARSVAYYLSIQHNASLLLGTATPSVESWYFSKSNLFNLYSLKERFGGAKMPDIQIIDSTKEKFQGNLSLKLIELINEKLKNNEQVVLLQNRRGFANYILCTECKEVVTCPKCDLALTYHKSSDKLICHYCGYKLTPLDTCPSCNSDALIKIGAGTERVEEEIQKTFPSAKIKRIDYDTMKKKNDINLIFEDIQNKKIDILIGTQMIAKGLHFPDIKLVGIINADLTLKLPDYKSSEKTFALITQVAGRAGRTGEKGLVIIQTINPEHYAILAAKNNDYEQFYETEIKFREQILLPPFTRIIRLIVRGMDENKVKQAIQNLSLLLKNKNNPAIDVLGPAPCIFSKINKNYRYQISLKSKSMSLMQNLLKEILKKYKLQKNIYLEIDVDPISNL